MTVPSEYAWLLEESTETVVALLEGYDDFVELVEIIGLEAVLALMAHMGGQALYVPKFPGPFRVARDSRIREECDGTNHVALARKYGLSVSRIYSITAPKPGYEQTHMFGGCQ